jgi:hypothetical protein
MKHLLYLPLILILIGSCKKKKAADPESQVATGSITGKTTQFSQYGEKLTTGLNNVTVSLDNDVTTTVTDNAGNYTLSGVKPGIYTIFFTKPGCGVYQVQQVNFPGNGTLYQDGTLIENPTFTFLSATAKTDTGSAPILIPALHINIKLNPNPKAISAMIVLGPTDDLDLNKSGSYIRMFSFTIPANTSDFISSMSYRPDEGAYAKIYPYSGNSISYSGNSISYHNYATNTNIFLGYGAALPAIKIQ